MPKFKQNMFHELEIPIIILSTRYHKHLGTIENINTSSINCDFNMNSCQEISFEVYKELNGHKCSLWDSIKDLKYIYVPDFNEYYEITVSLSEDNNTVKSITGKSACEAELGQRLLRDFECNTESDILRNDYLPTIFYNPENETASLLHRVLHDKCPDYKIEYVESTLVNIQRTFSCSETSVYDFLIDDVAEEIGCLFTFDSVNRYISVHDLKCNCNSCHYRGDFIGDCPECGSSDIKKGFGLNTNIFISRKNFADLISVEGDTDSVKNCFRITGGDDLMTATISNCNPNGSSYIYRFSDEFKADMPKELVSKIQSYDNLYNQLKDDYHENTIKLYEAIDQELYLTSEMMPTVTLPTTSAIQELNTISTNFKSVSVQSITTLSKTSADLAVKGMVKVIIDSRYEFEIISSTLSDLIDGTSRVWTGKFKVKNSSDEKDVAENTDNISVEIVGNNYEQYIYQKIQKTLDKNDSLFLSVFEISDLEDFKIALKDYCLDRLSAFESSYQTCIEVLIENGVTDQNATFFDVDLYNTMYKPYYDRIVAIQEEMVIRESEITEVQKINKHYSDLRNNIQKQLDFKTYIGEDLWIIFCSYLREDTYSNSNYISDGLSNIELIDRANELFETAQNEIYKASELQITLTSTLENLLSIKEFKDFIDEIDIGNWIICKVNDNLYKLRIIYIGIDYGDLSNISITFSNIIKIKNNVSDTESIFSQTQSMASTFDYIAHQANQGKEANDVVKDYKNFGLDAAQYNIVNCGTQDVIYDEHGLSCRKYDDVLNDYLPEQLRIINNTIAFTNNNWETVCCALGKLKYIIDGVEHENYGLNADHVIAGTIVSGHIYSDNYSSSNKTGTYINLEDGSFTFAGDKLVYNALDNNLSLSGNFIVGGENNLDGNIIVRDSNGNTMIEMNNTGIIMEDGTSIINSSGVCGDLTFTSGGTPYDLGWTGNVVTTGTFIKQELFLQIIVPDNYVITSAVLILSTCATKWNNIMDESNGTIVYNSATGYPRGIKAYIGNGQVYKAASWDGEYTFSESGSYSQIISGDFISNGVDGSENIIPKIIKSGDIKSLLKTGLNTIKFSPSDYTGANNLSYAQRTGTATALLSVKGYTKNKY